MSEEARTIVAVSVLLILALVMFWAPGHVAKSRGHPSHEAIAICGWLGIFFFPLWIIAVIWAHTGPNLRKAHPRAAAPARRRKHKLTRHQWDAVEALEEMR